MAFHAPVNYLCPFCLVVHGQEHAQVYTRQTDIVYRDRDLTVFICSHQFPTNHGHTLIVPNSHYENLYDLPTALGQQILSLTRALGLAMKAALGCAGVTVWQSNEPVGDQTVWHYHIHVIPRFPNDAYLQQLADLEHTYHELPPELRAAYAERLQHKLRINEV
ncbi:MAG: HIT family protein [Herpetosiphonaceae bacterium]|nr:HIT family protein [Herpetosiphonaceae bacterium]